jgi:hypothetical protein
MPADPTYSTYNKKSFHSGITLPNSGHLRVMVSPAQVKVDYVRAFLQEDEGDERGNGQVAYSYTLRKTD